MKCKLDGADMMEMQLRTRDGKKILVLWLTLFYDEYKAMKCIFDDYVAVT
jgi:hypothetical protein